MNRFFTTLVKNVTLAKNANLAKNYGALNLNYRRSYVTFEEGVDPCHDPISHEDQEKLFFLRSRETDHTTYPANEYVEEYHSELKTLEAFAKQQKGINGKLFFGSTPLIATILQGNLRGAKLLLEHGAKVNYVNHCRKEDNLSVFLESSPLGAVLIKYFFLLGHNNILTKAYNSFVTPVGQFQEKTKKMAMSEDIAPEEVKYIKSNYHRIVDYYREGIRNLPILSGLSELFNQLESKGAKFFPLKEKDRKEYIIKNRHDISKAISGLLKMHPLIASKLFISFMEELGEEGKDILKSEGKIYEAISHSYSKEVVQYFIDNKLINFVDLRNVNGIYALLAFYPEEQSKVIIKHFADYIKHHGTDFISSKDQETLLKFIPAFLEGEKQSTWKDLLKGKQETNFQEKEKIRKENRKYDYSGRNL